MLGWADLAGLGIEQTSRVFIGRLGYAPDAQVTDRDRVAVIAFWWVRPAESRGVLPDGPFDAEQYALAVGAPQPVVADPAV